MECLSHFHLCGSDEGTGGSNEGSKAVIKVRLEVMKGKGAVMKEPVEVTMKAGTMGPDGL